MHIPIVALLDPKMILNASNTLSLTDIAGIPDPDNIAYQILP